MGKMPKPSLILIKIDGTTTVQNFMKEVMIPYVEKNMRNFLLENWGRPVVDDLMDLLREESEHSHSHGAPRIKNQSTDEGRLLKEVMAYLTYVMSGKKRSPGYQMLSLLIWGDGFDKKDLKAHVFPDVADAVYCWSKMGITMIIYSGGVPTYSQMTMTFTSEGGNLGKFVKEFIAVDIYGTKDDDKSYTRIADVFRINAKDILFLTDDVAEAQAAKKAQCQAVIVNRAGGQVPGDLHGFQCVSSFLDIEFEMGK